MFFKLPDELRAELELIAPFHSWRRPEDQGPQRLTWTMRLIIGGEPERGALVRCLCDCARLALPSVGRHEHRPRKALEIAEAWTRSRDKKRRRAEESRLRRAIQDLRRYGAERRLSQPGERWAFEAALYTALATSEPKGALLVPQLVINALTGSEYAPTEWTRSAVEQLAGVLFGWRWPAQTRLPSAPCAPELLVAWDWLSERVEAGPTLSTVELLGAIACQRALLARLPEVARSETEQRLLYALAERISLGDRREPLIEGVLHFLSPLG